MERRPVLLGVGSALISILTGCANSSDDSGNRSVDPSDHVDDWHDERVQGRADPIETEDTVESSGDIEVRCAGVAKSALQSAVSDQLDRTPVLAFGSIQHPERNNSTEDERKLYVERVLEVGREGDVQEPEVSFSTLEEVTPSEINTTLRRNSSVVHTCRHEVYVRDNVVYVD